jgi:hypothetical protein
MHVLGGNWVKRDFAANAVIGLALSSSHHINHLFIGFTIE